MFKKIFAPASAEINDPTGVDSERSRVFPRRLGRFLKAGPARQIRWFYSVAGFLLVVTGCLSLPPLPRVNLSGPGWQIHQGQAVWRASRRSPEIAGEILLASNGPGRTFVQFTKTPFPFVIAQTTTNSWQIEAPAENRRFAGQGAPPARLIWFQLPRAWSGEPLPKNWSWQNSASGWKLQNRSTGESLEGYFAQ